MSWRGEQAERIDRLIAGDYELPDGYVVHSPPIVDERGFIWYVSYGTKVISGSHHNQPKPYTLHGRWSQRVNWWLSTQIGRLRSAIYEFSQWISDVGDEAAWQLIRLEHKLEGYDDL